MRYNPEKDLKCDFCSSKEVTDVFPCSDFEAPKHKLAPVNIFQGAWFACKACSKLVENNQMDLLIIRATKKFPKEARHLAKAYLKIVYITFFSLKKPGRKVSPGDTFEAEIAQTRDPCMVQNCSNQTKLEVRWEKYPENTPFSYIRVCIPCARRKLNLSIEESPFEHPKTRPLTPKDTYYRGLE